MIRKISAHWVFPVSSPPVKFGILIINNEEILELTRPQGEFREIPSLEFYSGILIPGLISSSNEGEIHFFNRLKKEFLVSQNASFEAFLLENTLSNASKLNMDKWYGSFEKGKTPGVNLISGFDFNLFSLTELSSLQVLIPRKIK